MPFFSSSTTPSGHRQSGLAGAADALYLAELARHAAPLAVVCASAWDANRLAEELRWFDPGLRVCAFPDWETLPYDTFSPHPDLISERLATLYQISRGEFDVAVVALSTALYRLAPVESDVPERAVQRVTPLAPATGANWPPHWPRPSRLLDPPELVETVALLPDHPPAAFTWRGMRRRVARADGPERIFGEWKTGFEQVDDVLFIGLRL